MASFKTYYQLAKPGIIYGNAINATGGFLLASKGHIDIGLLVAMLAGLALVIGSAGVINNLIDRDIDRLMDRTKKRALAMNSISTMTVVIYGSLLGIAGFTILTIYTNRLTVAAGLLGMFFYLIMYSYFKRRSVHGTLVGSMAGATPPVAGYLTITNHIDIAAGLLFVILVFWQMPHFYAIAIRRLKDYKTARLPVLPIVKGIRKTKQQMVFYILAFTLTNVLLSVFGYTHYVFALVIVGLGGWWLKLSIDGFSTKNNQAWAKKLFLFSLIISLSFSIMVSVGALLP
ncbi:protoheme IX farnesyltransferase [Candidatus Saccharibacteria bacterium]|nr:protoheme IX farnesyltransferase [Candidatus Saccharibacteria bacterium]